MNSYCSKCSAYENCNNPCIMGFGDINSPILFIGETTGSEEDYHNLALYNKDLIINSMEQFGSYYYTNAIKCKLADKKGKLRKPTGTEIDCCKAFTYKIINEMKPKVVVAMGSLVLKQLLGINMSIDVAHGKEFFHPYFNCYIIPTWDISSLLEEYVINNGKKTFIDNKLYRKQFAEDMMVAIKKLREAPKRKLFKELKTISNPVDIQEYLESLLTKEELVIDLETTGLDAKKDSITDIGLSTSPNEGVHIKWEDAMPHFELLKKVLESGIKVINHNIRFDAHFLANVGIQIKNMYFDTMLAYHTITMGFEGSKTESLYKLKVMSYFLTTDGGHDSILNEFGGIAGLQTGKTKKKDDIIQESLFSNEDMPIRKRILNNEQYTTDELDIHYNYIITKQKEELKELNLSPVEYYTAMDANITFRIYKYLKTIIDEQYPFSFYEVTMPMNQVLFNIEENGIMLDYDYMDKVAKANEEEMDKISKTLFKEVKMEFNISSPKQIVEMMQTKLKIKPDKKYQTPKGDPSTDDEAIKFYSQKKPVLNYILSYRELAKQNSVYLKGFKEISNPNTHRVYPSYLQHVTATGRVSCVAKGTQITMINGFKNIEDVEIGDYVYCYDDNGNLRGSKVLNIFDNGMRECVNIKWQSSGNHAKVGNLIVTKDHLIKTKYFGWVQAQNLKRYDKLFHLFRTKNNSSGRIRLYGANCIDLLEEHIIKLDILKGTKKDHIHHIDENKMNNNLDNLKIMTHEEHTSYHTRKALKEGRVRWEHLLLDHPNKHKKGKENKNYIYKTKEELIQMFYEAEGRIKYINMDSETYRNKLIDMGIDLNLLREEYKKHKREFGINHTVTSIRDIGIHHVYDLEVEEHHNFIANEICVHNCVSPSLHTTPRDNKIRNMIIPAPGCKLICIDMGQVELRVLAMLANDKNMISGFESGFDFHSSTACKVFNIDPSKFDKSNPDHSAKRTYSKSINFGIAYLMGAKGLAAQLKNTVEESQHFINMWFDAFPGVRKFLDETKYFILKNHYVETLYNRRRYLPYAGSSLSWMQEAAIRQGTNCKIQSPASDIFSMGMIKNQKMIDKYNMKTEIVGTVHDSIIFESPEDEVDFIKVEGVRNMVTDIPRVTIKLTADVDVLDKWIK